MTVRFQCDKCSYHCFLYGDENDPPHMCPWGIVVPEWKVQTEFPPHEIETSDKQLKRHHSHLLLKHNWYEPN